MLKFYMLNVNSDPKLYSSVEQELRNTGVCMLHWIGASGHNPLHRLQKALLVFLANSRTFSFSRKAIFRFDYTIRFSIRECLLFLFTGVHRHGGYIITQLTSKKNKKIKKRQPNLKWILNKMI